MILADFRWTGPHGIGRLAHEVLKRIPNTYPLQNELSPVHPFDCVWSSLQIMRTQPKPDLYFTPGYTPPLWSAIPFIFTICDLNHIDVPGNSSFFKRLYYQFVMLPASHRAACVLTISEFSRSRILAWSGLPTTRVINIGSGVDKQFTPAGNRYAPGYDYLLYVGNHKPHKNLNFLLESFARSGVFTKVKLLLTGNPDSKLLAEIQRLRLTDNVVFLGIVQDENLPALYRGALGLVFPSLYEGFGLPPLEAMACGTPVITSNTTSLPEVVGNAALLINPQNCDELALAISRLVDNVELRKKLHDKGLERAKFFSWEKTAQIAYQAILSTLEKSS